MTNIYPSEYRTFRLRNVSRITKPGTPVPAQWCDVHGIVVTDDDLCRNDRGDEWCHKAEDDDDQVHCRLLPLVVGT